MRFQQTSASVGPVWMANYCWLMLYYFTTKDCCREKGASGGGGGEGCETGRGGEGPGNPGRVPEGKKGLVNAIIIFKNITGATATSAKNRLGRAKLLHPLEREEEGRRRGGRKERRRREGGEGASTPVVNLTLLPS